MPLPPFGASASSVTVNETLMLASTNISTFVMMSRKGTILSSPASSSAASSFGAERRRMRERCAAVSLSAAPGSPYGLLGGAISARSALPAPLDREEVEDALLRRVEIVLDLLRVVVQQ